jgi:aerobic carbon-monoxide dehydrogenase small subunit
MSDVVVNGVRRTLPRAPVRLVDWLRDDLGLTGTKAPCGTGHCGGCTVLVDGEARLACCELAQAAAGTTITTIEGLERLAGGPELVDAFVTHGAIQCGFCTPGMLLAAAALDPAERADEEVVRDALRGNVCRCTGYAQIVRAVTATGGAGYATAGSPEGSSRSVRTAEPRR